jgi:hypothetical protein
MVPLMRRSAGEIRDSENASGSLPLIAIRDSLKPIDSDQYGYFYKILFLLSIRYFYLWARE